MKRKEEEEKKREYEAFLAAKKEEEEEEARLSRETEYQLNLTKAAFANGQSDVNSAILNLLESFNGNYLRNCAFTLTF